MDGWVDEHKTWLWERGRNAKEMEIDRKRTENGRAGGGKTGRGHKWREAAGRKMEQQAEGEMKRRK